MKDYLSDLNRTNLDRFEWNTKSPLKDPSSELHLCHGRRVSRYRKHGDIETRKLRCLSEVLWQNVCLGGWVGDGWTWENRGTLTTKNCDSMAHR